MDEDLPAAADIVMKYATYEEFLDSQVTRLDLSYLEVREKFNSSDRSMQLDCRMKSWLDNWLNWVIEAAEK